MAGNGNEVGPDTVDATTYMHREGGKTDHPIEPRQADSVHLLFDQKLCCKVAHTDSFDVSLPTCAHHAGSSSSE